MGVKTNTNILKAKDLLKDNQFDELISFIDSLIHTDINSNDLGELYLIKGEALLHNGNYKHDYFDKSMEIFRSSIRNDLFAFAKYLKGWQLQALGKPLEAKEPLIESYTAYLRIKDYSSAARALNRLAMISFQAGDISNSIENLQKSIDYYSKADNLIKSNIPRINLASVFFMSGNLIQSYKSYEMIEDHSECLNDKNKSVYLLTFSVVCALLGDFTKSKEIVNNAKIIIKPFLREKANYYEYFGWINILAGDYSEAEKALKKGLKISLEIAPESALISQIKRLFGDLYIATKKYKLAEKYTNEALVVAEKIGEKVEIAACDRIFAQLEQHKGNDTKAKDHFQKAIDLFKLIGSRYELAVTQYLAATSGLYHNGVRHAMLYMARDYFESERVLPFLKKIESALEKKTAKEKLKPIASNAPVIIAVNPEMKKLVEMAENVAQSDMSVLLTGETGTGKDLMASYIHHMSCREGKFVAVNCGAISNEMIESELFGHKRGSFTGAVRDRAGLFMEADNGTIYLNEITDASFEFQKKLLDVLDYKKIRRVGSNKTYDVNFRLIAATNHDLERQIQNGKFRADLYHRLNCVSIALPSLNERKEDIHNLALHFFGQQGFNVDIENSNLKKLTSLLSYHIWTGNVRQLKYFTERLSHDSGNDVTRMIQLIKDSPQKPDKKELLHILNMTDWNRSRTAEMLGVSEGTIRNWITKHELDKSIS